MLSVIAFAVIFMGCAASGYTCFSAHAFFSEDIYFSAKMLGTRADNAHRLMLETIEGIDRAASLTRYNSELSVFNRAAAGERVEVSESIFDMFETAREYYIKTDGAFNIAAAPLCELWKVDAGSLAVYAPELGGAHVSVPLPTASEVSETLAYCDPTSVTAQKAGEKYYLTKSDSRTRLDLGGIAKGYAIDRCVKILNEYDITSALLDISGNAYFYGRYRDNGKKADWRVGVVSPRPRSDKAVERGYVCAITLSGDESAVTSGDYNRYVINDTADGPLYIPHIICADGTPVGITADGDGWAASDEYVISATVIGESSAVCDILATAVCAIGFERGAQLLRKVGYKGLIFTEKRYTIVGDVRLYKPDSYNGYKDYVYEP